jgi:hypothetical protein
MDANELKLDLFALVSPKSNEDLIALAKELRAEMQRISDYIEEIFTDCECPIEP